MGLSLPSEVTVVVEDEHQKRFAFRYLRKCGLDIHAIRIEKSPPGVGSAENWVRSRFPVEVRFFRSRHSQKALIVMIDADIGSVAGRLAQLDRELTAVGQESIDASIEPIALLVPKRNIETWILSLGGGAVDEETDDKRTERNWGTLIAPAATALFGSVHSANASDPRFVPSLISGIAELKRLRF